MKLTLILQKKFSTSKYSRISNVILMKFNKLALIQELLKYSLADTLEKIKIRYMNTPVKNIIKI